MSKPLTTEEIGKRVDSLCEQVAEGKTLRQISTQMKLSVGMLLKMVAEPPYSEQYTRARESAADLFEADIITAAMAVTPETAAADRVQIEALKWVAGRRAPKKYGDRIQQDVTVDVKDGLADKMAAARERARKG
jgi:hypothetical protein